MNQVNYFQKIYIIKLYYFLFIFLVISTNVYSNEGMSTITPNHIYYNYFINKDYFQSRDALPPIIDSHLIYNKSNYTITKDNITITDKGSLTFNEKVQLVLKESTITNKGKKEILFDDGILTGTKSKIYSTVLLKNSTLTFLDGHINDLIIAGNADIAIKNSTFNTLVFTKELGATPTKTGIGIDKITAKELKIDFTGMKNNTNRNVNIKNATVDDINIKGLIYVTPENKPKPSLDIADKPTEPEKLKTNFNIEDSKVKKVTYINQNEQEKNTYLQLPSKLPGFINFKNTTIDKLLVSYNLLRGITLNGVTVTDFEIEKDSYLKFPSASDFKEENKPNNPKQPSYSNLQLTGTGTNYIKNFNLNGVQTFNIEGAVSGSYNAPLSSIYIYNMSNYKDTEFSLYHLKDVYFGVDKPQPKPDKDKKDNKPNKPVKPGGDKDLIKINYLQRVTTLGVKDNTIKFTWGLDKNKETNQDQYLSIYNLSQLNIVNSLIDITETNKLKEDPNVKNDPTKSKTPYDLNITYAGSMQAFGTIFHFDNTGAIVNNNRNELVPLRVRVQGNSFVTAKDMHSDLTMQLNGERNLFTLESNKNNKSYSFHTNYNYCYLDPVDGNQKPGCKSLQYNYWEYNESIRVEQNWYTFKADMVITDKFTDKDGFNAYEDYNQKHHGGKGYAHTTFTYWQPYKVDKEGKPSEDGKYGDKKAWDQKTDGSGRGGFPVEFGNKIEVVNSKVTFLKPLDNLTVLEVAGTGVLNFYDMNTKYFKPTKNPQTGKEKVPQWITILRMRGSTLQMANAPMAVDKLQVYSYGKKDGATFRPVLGESSKVKTVDDIINANKLIVNKEANFNDNYLLVDLYFNDFFIGLNHKITLNILELGDYIHKEKVKEDGKEKEKETLKQADLKNWKGVDFKQGLIFDTNYYWKDEVGKDGKKKKQLYVEITRVKDFDYFTNAPNKTISNIFDNILNKYSTSVDKDKQIQYVDKNKHPTLNNDTLKIINSLFQAKNKEDLNNYFISLRPINNEFLFNTVLSGTEKLLDTAKNANNYSYDNGKVAGWVNSSIGSISFSNNKNNLGGNVNNQTLIGGSHIKMSNVKVGAFVGYGNSKFNSAYYSGTTPLYGIGLYSDVAFKDNYFIKLSGVGAITSFKGSREQYFILDKAEFNIKGKAIDAAINFGKTYYIEEGFFTPYIRGNFGYFSIDKYTESGGSATLEVKEFNSSYYGIVVGLEYAKQIELSEGASLIPKLGLSYRYKYYNLPNTVASFNKINGLEKELNNINYISNNYNKNSILLNTGLNYLIGSKTTLNSNFSAELINKDITNYTIYLGFKVSI